MEENNSNLKLIYKEQEKIIDTPKNYSELKEKFLFNFNEKEISLFSFSYKDNEDKMIKLEDKEEGEILNFNDLKELTVYVTKRENDSEQNSNNNPIINNTNENITEEANKNINEDMQIEDENKDEIKEQSYKIKEEEMEELEKMNKRIKDLEKELLEKDNSINQEKKKKEEICNNYNNLLIDFNKMKEELNNQPKIYEEKYKKEIDKLNLINKEKDGEIDKLRKNLSKAVKEKNDNEKKLKKTNDNFEQYKIKINKEILSLKNENSNCKTMHKNVKCQRCFQEPIIGFRYKCSKCSNYNLCQKCEEQNSLDNDHPHLFLKIRNELIEKNENNIINEININDSHEYSFKCLTRQLKTYIYKGVSQTSITITLKNDGLIKWPENKTKLIQEKNNSNIICQIINLKAQNPKDQNNYDIQLNNLGNLNVGEYKVELNFNINGKNYGNKICLSVIINEKNNNQNNINNNIQETIEKFRQKYNFRHEGFTNEMIYNKLVENNYDFESTFFRLYFS